LGCNEREFTKNTYASGIAMSFGFLFIEHNKTIEGDVFDNNYFFELGFGREMQKTGIHMNNFRREIRYELHVWRQQKMTMMAKKQKATMSSFLANQIILDAGDPTNNAIGMSNRTLKPIPYV
jgi:hypothetical protein